MVSSHAYAIPDGGSGLIMFDDGAVVAMSLFRELLEDGQDSTVIDILKGGIIELDRIKGDDNE